MTNIKFDQEVRDKLLQGVKTLSSAVKVTLGPKGKNVIIGRHTDDPQVTKDGVTVAKEFHLEDPYERMGATLVKRVAEKSNTSAGDGTTTATVLTEAILEQGMKLVAAGYDPVEIKSGIDKLTAAIVEQLNKSAVPVTTPEQIKSVATISANNDEKIGQIVADAFIMVGDNGAVSVEEGNGYETVINKVEGVQFDRGMLSTFFSSSPEKEEAIFNNPYILVTDSKIETVQEVINTLELVSTTGRPLLIIAEDVIGQALSTLVMNKMRGGMQVAAVKLPGFGPYKKVLAKDIAASVGATIVPKEHLSSIPEENFDLIMGAADSVTINKFSTLILGGEKDEESVNLILKSIDAKLKDDTVLDNDKERLRLRKAKLKGGVAVIEVGAASEVDMKEKKDRIDDAKEAVASALEEGIVIGGGMGLIYACMNAKWDITPGTDEGQGSALLGKAIRAPFNTICQNANQNGEVKLNEVLSRPDGTGYDAKHDKYVDMIKEGIVDPKKVTRTALESASSVAGTLLTTVCGIVNE